MCLVRLKIENFRCYTEPFEVKFDELTAIVGRNDVGKSTLMDALSIFFEEAKPDRGDGSVSGNTKEVSITCTFDQLPDSLVIDTNNETSLAKEYLLNEDGHLEVQKVIDCSLATPKVRAVNAWSLHPSADGVNDLLDLKQAGLIKRATDRSVELSNIDERKNAELRRAIWEQASELGLTLRAVSLDSEATKPVWKALSTYLPSFALFKSDRDSSDQDNEAQDPLKSAIRDAIKGVETELSRIQEHVEREVRKIADATVEKIKEMDPEIADTLDPVISTGKWDGLFKTSITGDEGIPLNKKGSGVRRIVLLNFFRAKAERTAVERPTGSVIYAVEEPETSQHPRYQRLLMSALTTISSNPDRQVILTTHTPMLTRTLNDTALRFIERDEKNVRSITEGGGEETNRRIAKSLGVLPDHNVRVFVGVEGKHDISFLKSASKIFSENGHDVPNLENSELNGELIFFPFGGSNLQIWTNRLSELNRPEFHIYDRDNPPPADPKYCDAVRAVNGRENCIAVNTSKRELENYIHIDAITEAYAENNININLGAQFADFDDVPLAVARAVHVATAEGPWPGDDDEKSLKKISRAKAFMNNQAMTKMTADRFEAVDQNGEILGWLSEIGQMMAQLD